MMTPEMMREKVFSMRVGFALGFATAMLGMLSAWAWMTL